MRAIILLSFLLNATLHGLAANATGLLHADGIVTVEGAEISETTITVVPANAGSWELPKGTKEFKLELPLNDTYLVIFAHPRCLTKQLYFDTRVPQDYVLDHYTFPFEVVLQVQNTEDRAYAGPVGYIMYKDLVNDFDYVTDYTLQIDQKLKDRMNSITSGPLIANVSAATDRTPSAEPSVIRTASSSGSTSMSATPSATATVVGASGTDGTDPKQIEPPIAPIERETAPTVLSGKQIDPVIEERSIQQPVEVAVAEVPIAGPPIEEEEVTASDPEVPDAHQSEQLADHVPDATERTGPSADPSPTIDEKLVTASVTSKSEHVRLPSSSVRTGREFKAPDPLQFGRQEELIVEANKVTTIVRIVNELGYQHEYRRVAHKFGPVFYFKDDQSIPAHMYADGTGLPAN